MRFFSVQTLLKRKCIYRLIGLTILLSSVQTVLSEEINVYSSRKEHLIKPLFALYEKQTGVKISYVTSKAAPLIERLKDEGKATKADLLITVDAGNLWYATEQNVLQELPKNFFKGLLPDYLIDPNNHWTGLSIRARTIVYSKERVKTSELSTYEDLGSNKWKGRLCLRTSKKVYNQSLVASMIARMGDAKTESVIKSWVNNLAVKPFSNDTKVMEAIVAGVCDVGIVNTYYFGRLQKKNPDIPLALFWPNQKTSGVHVNISGAGVTRHAKNPKAAKKFLKWLLGKDAQDILASLNMEYPVRGATQWDDTVLSWGKFKRDDLNVNEMGRLQSRAVKLMDKAGYR